MIMEGYREKRIYVAGPLFSQSEREFDEKIAAICEELGYKTFLPHRDAGLQDHDNSNAIFDGDMRALNEADLVVCNLDGVDVDAGTAWEIGYAYAHGKAIVGIRTDRRVLEPWASVNLMIGNSVEIVRTLDELRGAISAAIEE
jgi:nucleoside 2-deoxyribosyltransferase